MSESFSITLAKCDYPVFIEGLNPSIHLRMLIISINETGFKKYLILMPGVKWAFLLPDSYLWHCVANEDWHYNEGRK